jgi:hypothetical protein
MGAPFSLYNPSGHYNPSGMVRTDAACNLPGINRYRSPAMSLLFRQKRLPHPFWTA